MSRPQGSSFDLGAYEYGGSGGGATSTPIATLTNTPITARTNTPVATRTNTPLATRTNTDLAAVTRTYAVYIEEGKVIPVHSCREWAGVI